MDLKSMAGSAATGAAERYLGRLGDDGGGLRDRRGRGRRRGRNDSRGRGGRDFDRLSGTRITADDDVEARREEKDAAGADDRAEKEEDEPSEERCHGKVQEPALISMTSCGAASRWPAGVTRM
jgi:hypothetical protein